MGRSLGVTVVRSIRSPLRSVFLGVEGSVDREVRRANEASRSEISGSTELYRKHATAEATEN